MDMPVIPWDCECYWCTPQEYSFDPYDYMDLLAQLRSAITEEDHGLLHPLRQDRVQSLERIFWMAVRARMVLLFADLPRNEDGTVVVDRAVDVLTSMHPDIATSICPDPAYAMTLLKRHGFLTPWPEGH